MYSTGPAGHVRFRQLDLVNLRSWALITKAGYITEEHHDDSGQVTWVFMEDGRKLWLWYPMPEEFDRSRAMGAMIDAVRRIELARHKPQMRLGALDHRVLGLLLKPGDLL
jgi:hypothetical protein